MSSSRRICEIVEVKDDPSTTTRNQTFLHSRGQEKPPIIKQKSNKSLENDINKLFESVNLRASKSLDLSNSNKNPSKKPMRYSGNYSPGIGFSEPVTLKQALRGMCISQAAEVAAAKRLSMPSASPRVSEAGRISNLYKSVVESGMKISPVQEESTSSSSSSFGVKVKPVIDDIKCVDLVVKSADSSKPVVEAEVETVCSKEEKPGKKVSGSKKMVSGLSKDSATFLKAVNRATAPPKLRKSRLQVHSTKSNSRVVKKVVINKNLVIRKSKKVMTVSTDGDSKSKNLICQKCQCSLSHDSVNDSVNNSIKNSPETSGIKPGSIRTVLKINTDISQSSKSSICEFSSSTTSLSEDSNLSGPNFSSRPHMSKDSNWEAIRKQGFLGLSHFNLLKKLGSGDIGTVYLAELIGTGCMFAIKVMDNEFLGRRKKMARAQTEREILRMLDHPFLPTLYAQFTSDNLSCLVMEFCPGGDLHVLRQKQPGRYFPEQAARFYVAEVLLALEYLHMLGIVYRDLKPENILVRKDGHIMLTDFDLSLRCSVNPTLVKPSAFGLDPPRLSGPCAGSNCIDPFCNGPSCKVSCFTPRLLRSTPRGRKVKPLPQLVAEPTEARSNSFVGTHEYLAPEIIKGEGHGSAVDWWTLGVFLYELLYGKTPFKGSVNDETLSNVVLQNLRFPDGPIVSFQARDLIRGLLVKEPENRLGTETGAAEIKRHSFFEGMNWALIRCETPPEIPEIPEYCGNSEKVCGGEQLEFELF